MRFRQPLARTFCTPAIWVLISTLWLTGCASSSSLSTIDKPDANSAYTRLGVAYLEQNNLSRALHALDRARELDAGNPETLQALALVYQRQGEDTLASDYFQKALEADADFTRGRNNYAAFLYQRGAYKRACQQLETASQDAQYAHRARLFTNLGQCYMALDDTQRARESLVRASTIDPRHASSYFYLARLELAQGNHVQARAALQRFFKLARPTREALDMAVTLARARGDDTLAADYQRQLERMNGSQP
ncbi:MAG: type IV pilus biogenesis/stability protein PilW [Halomonas sp.]|nr:type IV pilus biogenesis/stability protein PilW [Halomonas sp.]MDN6296647.1 type IV pilus biogenesis/stability protein PilW [Halomonas sp.]MDN6314164.1 type IV pilus biogenesis/stability protein PilW [Halomonas sp.]MDN6335153.1 type IV pilus biogenesis/stability protein PilW [Halomonas sp.]